MSAAAIAEAALAYAARGKRPLVAWLQSIARSHEREASGAS
ncbi:hypothetical protein [Ramlibacter sp. 2FC]|nr:hypothetical protein [Ramlibacter sp. 2FC]